MSVTCFFSYQQIYLYTAFANTHLFYLLLFFPHLSPIDLFSSALIFETLLVSQFLPESHQTATSALSTKHSVNGALTYTCLFFGRLGGLYLPGWRYFCCTFGGVPIYKSCLGCQCPIIH